MTVFPIKNAIFHKNLEKFQCFTKYRVTLRGSVVNKKPKFSQKTNDFPVYREILK